MTVLIEFDCKERKRQLIWTQIRERNVGNIEVLVTLRYLYFDTISWNKQSLELTASSRYIGASIGVENK